MTLVWRNSFTLPAGFLFDIDGTYYTKGHIQNMYMGINSLNVSMGLYKSFFKERLSFQLQVTNLLEKMMWTALFIAASKPLQIISPISEESH